jgi:ketosteroid isomerase-like protein|tara:strand:- start:283 stop:774 length:492 start_codon:yes stop_codon:yes gene_type:complete
MKKFIVVSISILFFSCSSSNQENQTSKYNLDTAQSFLDNIIINPEFAKSLLHEDFTFAWMGIIEQGGKIWNRDNLFNEYFKNIIPEILPNGIILKTVDAISDNNGVAIIQEGDAEGKNGEYDNKYVWIFKMKDGLIHSVREYNSDILVATQLYDYKLVPLEKE